jgi:TRAP-type mannitol/chloroaromatic compound transport system permease large subunit
VAPFLLLEIPILIILIAFPDISTWLPSKMFGH